ncbi:MAG: response regulator [bacterium]|nr:response regulator [bacterium]
MKTVLAVDDSSTMRMAVSMVLKSMGYDVMTANDGREALEKMRNNRRFNLIITDINMPNMDGLSLIKEARKMVRYDSTPILILTTEGDNEKKEAGRAAGANDWIKKPFKPQKLIDTIKKVEG